MNAANEFRFLDSKCLLYYIACAAIFLMKCSFLMYLFATETQCKVV